MANKTNLLTVFALSAFIGSIFGAGVATIHANNDPNHWKTQSEARYGMPIFSGSPRRINHEKVKRAFDTSGFFMPSRGSTGFDTEVFEATPLFPAEEEHEAAQVKCTDYIQHCYHRLGLTPLSGQRWTHCKDECISNGVFYQQSQTHGQY